MLTDGDPTSDSESDSDIRSLAASTSGITDTFCAHSGDNCLDEMADVLHNRDINLDLADKQTVESYFISFDPVNLSTSALQLLDAAAEKGEGNHYPANNARELTEIFTQIIGEILAVNTTFTSPAVSVNAFNRTTNLDQLYYTIFEPNQRVHWDGNLKRFKLDFDDDNNEIITDGNGDEAISAQTGFFKDTAQSFWTSNADAPDGSRAAIGGAASNIAPTS